MLGRAWARPHSAARHLPELEVGACATLQAESGAPAQAVHRRARAASAQSRERTRLPDRTKAKGRPGPPADRKSTRLNSSHSQISYAVFCLKKKKKKKDTTI